LIAGLSVLKASLDRTALSMREYMYSSFSTSAFHADNLSVQSLGELYKDTLLFLLPLLLPLFLVAMIAGALLNVIQTGPLLVFSKLKPDFKKISLIQGFKRIFSSRTLVELGKSVIKLAIIGGLIYQAFYKVLDYISETTDYKVTDAFKLIMTDSLNMGIKVGGALLAFSIADIIYQWWRYEKDLMMTKEEVKEEHKQTEGNPQTKSRIRQAQRKMSARRMMQNMRKANVVVANPTHFAVALKYNRNEDSAPVVVAKGQDYLALKIKNKARELKIQVVEDKLLARALYQACDIDEEIPPELYQAVAEILVYVYRNIT
jgi:flagellar biosynthetic protein FlhB